MGLSSLCLAFASIFILSKLVLIYLAAADSLQSYIPTCHDAENAALLQFKQSFVINISASQYHGAYPKTSSWKSAGNQNNSCCSWDGVECDENTGHVIGLDLSSSRLYGSFSSNNTLFSLVHLQSLNLADNNFIYSQIPISIRNFPKLRLSGMLPHCFNNFTYLEGLSVGNNLFHGTLPQVCTTNRSSLKMMDASRNQLLGKLPRSLANCLTLESLVLSSNKFDDVFPTWLGILPELKVLAMKNSGFHGAIRRPPSNHGFPDLRILDLSQNNFTGQFPSEFIFSGISMGRGINSKSAYMSANNFYVISSRANEYGERYDMTFHKFVYSVTLINKGLERYFPKIYEDFMAIDLSSNRFEGRIPELIGNLKGLRSLNVSNNMLTGRIPPSLGNLKNLEALDLSQNKLSGEIPQVLLQLSFLEQFNVSHNNLTGRILHGNQFSTFENTSYEGNPGLCGDPLPKKCARPEGNKLPPSTAEENGSSTGVELEWKFAAAGLVSGLVVGVVLADFVITRWSDRFIEIVALLIRLLRRMRGPRS
ncbi:receptor-like protein 11 isoform X2 [Rosa chinensis]|uniref:receptor-like protein 11 isoform X2 n=1 Tax=Rosa chinensis TaxID=74649 RepID=UPI001AD8DA66|nr:receptor-like protein 11 isoform X2 [Rosa chinensis]